MNRVVITGYGVTSPMEMTRQLLNSKEGTNGILQSLNLMLQTGITLAGEVKDFPYDKYFIKKIANEWICFRSMESTLL